MLKLYNKEHVAVAPLTNLKDYKIEYLLSGEDLLEFSLSRYDENISIIEEECYIRTKHNEYVVKAIEPSDNFKRFTCNINIESLVGKFIKNFDTNNNNLTDTIRLAIAGTGWILEDNNITKTRTIKLKNTNALEVLREVRKVFRVDYRFDAINKIIHVCENLGSDKGVYFSDELNLISLNAPSDSYDYATRLYARGKDGITFADINNGKDYIENFQYSNKIIEKIWEDNRYTNKQNLKEDAQAKLEELSKPRRNYNIQVYDLAKNNSDFSFLDFFLGDTVTIISNLEKFKDKQRIVKYIEYPNDPSKNSCELGNTTLTFEELQKENEAKNKVVDNTTIGNGIVNGESIDSIKTEQISDFEASVAKITDLTVINAKIENLTATNVTITGELNAVKANVGTLVANVATIDSLTVKHTAQINNLIATSATITQLNAVSATINTLEVEVGKIETLVNGNLSSENIQAGGITSDKLTIANGFITNAMISSLDVAKINAGDISTNKFRITSDSGNMLISDNTIQIRDNSRVRVQIGKDASNDYNMYVWDANGNLMFDATGLKAGGIKDKIIRDDMISDNANIDGHKLNINSVVTQINNGSTTIKSSKVQIDGLNQTLDVAFNSLKTQVDETKTTTESNSTTIGVMQGQISTAINNTQIVKDGQTILLKDDYNRTVATVDSMKSTIGSHTTQINNATGKINNVETKVNTVERDLNSITARVSSTETKIDNIKIGVRNILKDGGNLISTKNYKVADYYTHKPLEKGKTYTLVFKGAISDGQQFGIFYNNGYAGVGTLERKPGSAIYIHTFEINLDLTQEYISIFNIPNKEGVAIATIEWACLYEGNVKPPLDYISPIEDIQVGGRNLLTNKILQGFTGKGYSKNSDNSYKLVAGTNISYFQNDYALENQLANSEFTFSVNIKYVSGSKAQRFRITIYHDGAWDNYYIPADEITDTYKLFSKTVKLRANSRIGLCVQIDDTTISGTTYMFKDLKLERGNKATDYTPAPEDIEAEITTTKSKVAAVEVNLGSITSRVSSVETTTSNMNGQVSNLLTRMNSAEQKITSDSIISTVSSQFYSKGETDSRYAAQSQITQLANQISSKVDVNGVVSTIRQNPGAVQFGFNGIDARVEITNDGMFFKNNAAKNMLSIKRGYMHLYNQYDSSVMGGLVPRTTLGGQYYDNGVSCMSSHNSYYFSIAKADDWINDTQATFTPREYLVVNFRDRGNNKMGIHTFAPLYAHDGINLMGKAIINADTITANNLSCISFRHPNGNEMFSSDGFNMSNKRNWNWNNCNILDPVIIGGSINGARVQMSYSLADISPGGSVGADTISVETMLLQEDFSEYDETNNTVVVNINEAVKSVYANNKRLENENEQLKQENKKLNEELAMTKNALDAVLMDAV